MSEGAARVAATRLRQQYREILQTEVARSWREVLPSRGLGGKAALDSNTVTW
jgi:hypothetical protein